MLTILLTTHFHISVILVNNLGFEKTPLYMSFTALVIFSGTPEPIQVSGLLDYLQE